MASCGRDHLRVCGADRGHIGVANENQGSSPRVRSRRVSITVDLLVIGIISACAEQTIVGMVWAKSGKDHLRVCGADPWSYQSWTTGRRIISACAEQT